MLSDDLHQDLLYLKKRHEKSSGSRGESLKANGTARDDERLGITKDVVTLCFGGLLRLGDTATFCKLLVTWNICC